MPSPTQIPSTIQTTKPARHAVGIGAALLATALLGGCGNTKPDQFAPACPELKLLRDAADLTRMRGQGSDLTDMIVQARIVAVPASCKDGPKSAVRATMQVTMDATRGPAAPGRIVELPYLVTILRGERLLEQKAYMLPAEFKPNVDRARFTGDEIDLVFPISAEHPASEYTIYVSFQLTAAELAFNRRGKR